MIYKSYIHIKQLWTSTQHVRRRFHTNWPKLEVETECVPTINQDVIYSPSQSSLNLNHPDFCTCYCFMLFILFYIFVIFLCCAYNHSFRFCARFLKICEGQNRRHFRDISPLNFPGSTSWQADLPLLVKCALNDKYLIKIATIRIHPFDNYVTTTLFST
jgi:hypothetical protein